jgi:hypothetical protein
MESKKESKFLIIHRFLSNWEKEKGKRKKRENPNSQNPKSKERIQILDENRNPVFSQEEFQYFHQGMENHRFLSFWKREKREKPEFPQKKQSQILHEKGLGIGRSSNGFLSRRIPIFPPKEWKSIDFSLFGK